MMSPANWSGRQGLDNDLASSKMVKIQMQDRMVTKREELLAARFFALGRIL